MEAVVSKRTVESCTGAYGLFTHYYPCHVHRIRRAQMGRMGATIASSEVGREEHTTAEESAATEQSCQCQRCKYVKRFPIVP
jgi:hypothetical protein